ncbi:MAG: ribosome small subunit-dependent GTPase A [Actinomycetota bacterium]
MIRQVRRDQYDESDARVRPSRRGSKPRTKQRPEHRDAIPGFVVAVDRGRYLVTFAGIDRASQGAVDSPEPVTAIRARALGRHAVVVGDGVDVVGDTRGGPDSLARIVRVHPRRTVLRRTADDTDPTERILVANADQLVIVTATAQPEPRSGMVNRCLVAAYDGGLTPILVMTKTDLADPTGFVQQYTALDVPIVLTHRTNNQIAGASNLRTALTGHRSVLVGHSGVGKSTLVNALVPHADRATGKVNAVTGRGRHTSSSAIAFQLPTQSAESLDAETWIIDTPGVRSFGLAHVQPDHVLAAFPELAAGLENCPRGCRHTAVAECGLDGWVAGGGAGPGGIPRLSSLRRILHASAHALEE